MTNFKWLRLVIGIWSLVSFPSNRVSLAAETPPAKQRLLDRTPFDEVTLNPAAGGNKLEVLPLRLPQRPLVTIPTDGKLKLRLLDRPTEDFEVAWANVAQVRVFEQMLLAEAQRLTAAGQFDETYDYLSRLRAEYPNFPGLDIAICDYLQRNALALDQQKQPDRALALLVALHDRSPSYAALPDALKTVASEIIERHLHESNYAEARRVLDLWQTEFRGVAAEAAADWQRQFESAAETQAAQAARHLAAKQYVAARKEASRALAIWPTLDSATRVMAQIEREFPFVSVGVFEAAPRQPVRRIDDWATMRASRLTQSLLAEEIDFGSEGGVYRSPFGTWSIDETGRELTLKLNSSQNGHAPTADAIARSLISMAAPGSPNFRADFASLLASISLAPDNSVTLHLKRAHVRPEALLQVALPDSGDLAGTYSIAENEHNLIVFGRREAARHAGPRAVVEQTMPTDEAAVIALLAGEIDVLDRVPPWQIERLRAAQGVQIANYKLPTVHVLIPNLKRPLLAKREFRRALCFGIDRKAIVERVLLGGRAIQGFQALSGPFPAGTSLNDPAGYAYKHQIAPRQFEPRLAAILATVAWSNVQHPTGKNTEQVAATDVPELTLAHPTDPIARVACQSIQVMLAHEGIPVKLREFTADDLATGKVDCDLRYAELSIGEPVTDARSILGPGGLVGDTQSSYLHATLRDLNNATNWKDARAQLAELHEIANHELPVIPLWQTVNYFAYRDSVHGIDASPIALYQNIDQWSLSPGANVARADAAGP